jgi:uracil-DNA glycosylase
MDDLLRRIRACTHCAAHLPHSPRPVLAASTSARLLIIGQAPGAKVHESGVPWQDASGRLLREWLDVDEATFYDPQRIALLPMGFCFPGRGASGDLPPRPECAPLWHDPLLKRMQTVQLTLLIGQYSQRHYLGASAGENLTATVRNFGVYLPRFLPLPHPSPRNRPWLAKNRWFEHELVPVLRQRVREALS